MGEISKMKKMLSIILAAAIELCSLELPVFAFEKKSYAHIDDEVVVSETVERKSLALGSSFVKNGLKYTELEDGTYEVGYNFVNGSKPSGSVTIPETVNGKRVTRIAEAGFANCDKLTKITVPNSVIGAGAHAFEGTPFLENQSGSVKYAGKVAVWCSDNAVSVSVKAGTLGLADKLFATAENLEKAVLPSGLLNIGSMTFSSCSKLTTVNIPAGLKTIGSGVFAGCKSLTSITVPSGITSVGAYAFSDTSLSTVTIPNTVTKIGKGAFENSKLKAGSVKIGSGNIDIGGRAFAETPFLTSQGNLKYAGSVLVEAVGSITSATVKNGTTAIADMAFINCEKLKSVSLPNTLKTIGSDAFFGCGALSSITVPEGVQKIGEDAFRLCVNLSTVKLPKSLKLIELGAFYGCSKIKTVNLSGSAADWAKVTVKSENTPLLKVTPTAAQEPKKPAAVTSLKAASAANSVKLTWGKNDIATSYQVDMYKNGAWVGLGVTNANTTTYTVTGLSPNTSYQFRVFAYAKNIYSSSAKITVKTKMTAPKNFTATTDPANVKLSWSKVNSADKYQIDVLENGKWSNVASPLGSATTYNVKGLSGSTEYTFRIMYYVGNTVSAAAKVTFKTAASSKPGTVTNLKAAVTANNVALSWNKVPDADSYRVYIYKNGGWVRLCTIKNTSYTVSGLNASTSYKFRVFALKGSDYGAYAAISAVTKPGTVTNLKTEVTTNSVTLSWNKASGADSYRIYIYKNGGWVRLCTIKTNTYTVNGLSTATLYKFRVFALKGSSYGAYAAVNAATKPRAVTNLKAAVTANSVTLSWNKVSNADSYRAYIYKNDAWVRLCTIKNTSYTVSGLNASTSYKFRVFALKGSVYGAYTAVNAFTKPDDVKGVKTVSGGNYIKLSWNRNTSADKYQIDQYKDGKWVYAARTTGTSYTISKLSAASAFRFRIYAFKGNVYSTPTYVNANTAAASGKPGTVADLRAFPTANSVTLSWSKNTTADSYRAYIWKNGNWVRLCTIKNTSYTVSGLNSSTTYKFRVFALKGSEYGAYAAVSALTKPSAVTGVKAVSGANYVKLSWNKNTSADIFRIHQYKNGNWVNIGAAAGTSYTVSKLSPASAYQFRITAVKGSLSSGAVSANVNTTAASGKPGTVANLKAVSTTDSVTLSWNKNTTADSYRAYIYKNGGWVRLCTIKNTSYTVQGLSASTTYKFRVFALKGSDYGAYAAVSVTTKSATAANNTVTIKTAAASSSTNKAAELSGVNVMMKGIDVSGYQGTIDFKKVKASGVDFVIVKAGYSTSTVDTWEINYANAKKAGLMVGAYWYSTATTLEQGRQEAQAFIAAMKGKKFEFPVYFDIEESDQFALGKEFCTQLVETFCGTLEKAGYYAGVYSSTYWYTNFVDDSVRLKRPAWIADYRGNCYYTSAFGMWQYDAGYVSGVEFDCDLDTGYVDYSKYIKAHHLNGF